MGCMRFPVIDGDMNKIDEKKTEGVHALVLSEGAEEVFLRFGMPYRFDVRVPAIRNRAGDGFCPMEQAVLGIEDPLEALKFIRIRLAQLQEGIK